MGIQNHKTSATTNNINMKVIIALSALFAVAAAIPAGPPAYGAPAVVYEDTPPVYAYEYGVADDYSGNVAQVTYEGVASYGPAPAYKPAPHPVPAYKPAPYHA